MKYQFFAQGPAALKAELKKEEKKYMAAIERGAVPTELSMIKERILVLHAQLGRSANLYSNHSY